MYKIFVLAFIANYFSNMGILYRKKDEIKPVINIDHREKIN